MIRSIPPHRRRGTRKFLLCLLTLSLASVALLSITRGLAFSPMPPIPLGNYPDKLMPLGANTTVTPDAAPTSTTSINVSTSTNFKGRLEGNPTTGVVRITDAHPAGTFTVTVTAFDGGPSTKTFLLTVTTPATCNPVTFATAANFSAGNTPSSVAVGDFNGDGKQDLASANFFSNDVSILLGNGAGSFSAATNFGVGSNPASVAVGDFNGDGRQDLATANSSVSNVSVLLGNGAGGFGAATNFGVGTGPRSVVVADFNDDGKQDLAAANDVSNNVSVLLGDGAGGFTAATNFGVGTQPESVSVGDFNSDGKQDLATANQNSNNVSVLLGNGAGSFSAATNFVVGTTPTAVAMGDFNGDSKQDLATTNNGSNNVSVLLGDGGGGFTIATNFNAGLSPFAIAVGDFSGDGKQDLAVGNNNSNNVSVLLGDGAGAFGAASNFGVSNPFSLAVGDFNGDGKQDLATANANTDTVSVLLRQCGPLFVTNTNDTGAGSLRQAILDSNASTGLIETIVFLIGGPPSLHTISPTSPLPVITDPVIIDGYTQPGASVNTLATGDNASLMIELDGTNAGASAGLTITGGGSTIRGLAINRFASEGIGMSLVGGNIIQGNFIGTDATGTADLGNTGAGVAITGASNNNQIGLNTPAARNLISANTEMGVFIGNGPANNAVIGNYIGANAAGTADLGNGTNGVHIFAATNNTIGGATTAERNVISGNDGSGVFIGDPSATGNIVLGNFIGTNATGASALGNTFNGVVISAAPSNTIGGAAAGTGNVIAFNGAKGVIVETGAINNSILRNSIFQNGGLGIDLNNNDVTPNDLGDPDTGANNLQNFPVITFTSSDGITTFVRGAFNSTPNSLVRLEFFSSLICDELANGEGRTFLGSISGLTDASGNLTVLASLAVPTAVGQVVTATATIGNNTSEFSRCSTVTVPPVIVTNTNDSGAGTLRQALLDSNATAGTTETVLFDIPNAAPTPDPNCNANGVCTITPLSPLPNITDPVIIDGATERGYSGTPLIELNGTSAGTNGLSILAGSSTVRALIVNRFPGFGIKLDTGDDNTIEGCYIGTNAAGTVAAANGSVGIRLENSANNQIGGTTAAQRNIISGNSNNGIDIDFGGSTGNNVQGNYIGTNAAGTAGVGNGGRGVVVFQATANNIGDTAPGAGNLISGNANGGITLSQSANANVITGNFIGTDVTGTTAITNLFDGISLDVNSMNNTIGGLAAGAGNTIAFNNQDGVDVMSGSTGNSIIGNSIFANGTTAANLGIDLVGVNGVNANDAGDSDTGANNVQNFPVVTSAVSDGGNTVVGGTLNSTASTTFTLQFFSNPTCSISGNGEGKTLLGTTTVTTNASGNATFNPTLASATSVGQAVTATATDPSNNTSEFSQCITVTTSTATLGNYANTSVQLGANTTVTPSAAPTNTTSINVSTSTNFKGKLEGNPTTGVVRVTDAHPADTYTVTVTAFNSGGGPTTKTFTLTVTTPATCNPVTFGAATNFGVGNQPFSVVVGDFNGDGKQDLATANASSADVSILLGNGAGDLSAATNFAVGSSPASVAVGDFNGDGKQDLATANVGSFNVSVLLGDGAGGFSAATNFAVGSFPFSVAVGDFNSDGKQDLAAANRDSNNVSVLLGDGAGSFSAATNFAVGTSPRSVAVGDFNGDSKQDLATANLNSNNVSVLLGDGAGGFSAATNFGVGTNPVFVAVGDFNGDGKQDLSTANQGSAVVSVVLGDGAGSFSAAASFGVDNQPVSVAVGDFNGDGKQDLAVANNSAGNVSILLGDGIGSFGAATNLAVGSQPLSVAVGDFNGDGKQDLAIANNGSASVSVLLRQCPAAPTLTVTNTNDSGAGSLRQAILDSNGTAGVQTIAFNIPGGGVQTITPVTPLPDTADGVTIDGTTQPGYAGTPLIELSGASAGVSADGLRIMAGSTVLRALIVNRFARDGIALLGGAGGSTIQGCYVGTNAAGTAAQANGRFGIAIIGITNNTIGGTTAVDRNVISGNGVNGVLLQTGANNNTIVGNNIGTDVTGTAAVANTNGIEVNGATGNTIGGTTAGAGNVISGNTFNGVFINSSSSNNVVLGNRIGTNPAGNAAIANGNIGVRIVGSANNTVGGNTAVARNIISGNVNSSVGIENAGSTGNKVQGNYIGTDINGTVAIGNGAPVGIASGAANNLIGGSAAGEGNVISGNLTNGVAIFLGAHDNRVEGNLIGVNASGTGALGNLNRGVGIFDSGTNNNVIGGTAVGAGNVIANSGNDGISLLGGTGNSLLSNSINSNGTTAQQLGIDLNDDGLTPNDAGDPDGGPNGLQNFPIITSATTSGGVTTVSGTFNSTSDSTNFRVEFFANTSCDASGNGEGARFLGFITTNTDGQGNTVFTNVTLGATTAGEAVTATATDSDGNTSEFSACRLVGAPAGFSISGRAVDDSANALSGVAINLSGSASAITTTDATGNYSFASVAGGGNYTVTPSSSNFSFSPASQTFNNLDVNRIANFVGTRIVVSISGNITDSNNVPINNVTLALTRNGAPAGTAQTNAQGDYSFGNLTAGASYVVTPAGSFTPSSLTFANLSTNASANFKAPPSIPQISVTISGRIADAKNNPLSDVTVTLSGPDTKVTQTDANGNYSFSNLETARNYAVTLQSSYYVFAASRADFSNLTSDQTVNLLAAPVAVPSPTPPLSDDFNSPTRDPNKWSLGTLTLSAGSFDPQVTTAQSNAQLVITPRSQVSGLHYNGYVSANSFDMRNGRVGVEVVKAATGGADTIFAVGSDVDNFYRFMVHTPGAPTTLAPTAKGIDDLERPLDETVAQLVFQIKVGGQLTSLSINYDPVLHRFMRFRHEPPTNSIVFETSPDGIAYTVRQSVVLQKGVSALTAELSAGTSSPTNPGGAVFDNFGLITSTFQFSAGTYAVGESDGSVLITVTRSGSTTDAASVHYETADGTAAQANKYIKAVGTLSFAPGQTSKTFSVLIVDNAFTDGNEALNLLLSNPTVSGLNSPGRAVLTITDNDTTRATGNPLDDPAFFVRQQYFDFLNREPDASGLAFWINEITQCGSNTQCVEVKRINVSAAFFLSIEFQETGYLVYRIYEAAYGNLPGTPVPVRYGEFLPDTQQIGQGVVVGQPGWEQALESNKVAFTLDFVSRSRFTTALPTTRTPAEFVDALYLNAGVTPSSTERTSVINEFGSATTTTDTAARGRALRRVAENSTLTQQEFNRAFVLMQYFGYLRRNPNDAPDADFGGYNFWLGKLNQFNGNFVNAEMVKAFIVSDEYKRRFGP